MGGEPGAEGKSALQGANRGATPETAHASKLTEPALYEAALRYLDRQDGSVEQVRRSLHRRIARFGDDTTRPAASAAAERVLQRLVDAQLLDDARFALGFAQSQRRRGASARLIRNKLKQRGLSPEHVDAALAEDSDANQHDELSAAQVYARKRRLTERYDLGDPLERNKALAALARRGFSFDVARRALGL